MKQFNQVGTRRLQSSGSGSAVALAVVWAAHVMEECSVHAEGCQFTELLFDGMSNNCPYM